MKSKSQIIDTNVIIRFLTQDDDVLATKAENLFKSSKPKSLIIPDVVFAETIYVLLSVYGLSKGEVVNNMRLIIDFEVFKLSTNLLSLSLEIFNDNNLSFIDSYILALSKLRKNNTVYSFDEKLIKHL